MKVIWRNDALCLRPETEIERQALAAIVLNNKTEEAKAPAFSGEEVNLEFGRIEH